MAVIDLSKYINNNSKFKNKTIKVNKLTDSQTFNFGNTITDQVKVTKSGGKLVVSVYKQAGAVTYTYKGVSVEYGHMYKGKCDKWVTTYEYDINGNIKSNSTKHTYVKSKGKDSTTYYVYKDGKKYKTVSKKTAFKDYESSTGKSVSKTKLGTYTFTGVSNAGDGISVYVNGEDILKLKWEVKGNSSGYFGGTELNEYSTATAKNEHFNLGAGEDTIYYNSGSNFGKDVIDIAKNTNLNLVFSTNPKKYEIKNKDVIMYLGDNKGTNGTVKLKGYLSKTDASVSINGTKVDNMITNTTLGDANATKKQKLMGTRFDETFNCGKKGDTVYTGGGTDIINSGDGNDKIIISGAGKKTIYINSGDGKDTISRANQYATADTHLQFGSGTLSYVKNGYNLEINSSSGQSAVLKNFFNNGIGYKKTYASDVSGTAIGTRLDNNSLKLLVDKKDTSIVTVKGSKYSDKIYGGKRTNSISAEDGNNEIYISSERVGKTTMKANKGNDVYNIKNDMSKAKNTYVIADKGGTDSIIISQPVNMISYFNVSVDRKGNISNETTLHFLEKSTITSGKTKYKKAVSSSEKITIENALSKDGSAGNGWIESMTGHTMSTSTINTIRSQVASWLTTNHYSSVSQALGKASETDLQSLMQIYINKSL